MATKKVEKRYVKDLRISLLGRVNRMEESTMPRKMFGAVIHGPKKKKRKT